MTSLFLLYCSNSTATHRAVSLCALVRYTAAMAGHAQVLQSLGLSDKEAAVYLTLLALGGANAQTVSTQAKVKRGTVYTVLDSLMKRGLVSTAATKTKTGGTKQLFYPEDPIKLERILEERKQEVLRAEEETHGAIEELRHTHLSRGTRPVVRYFEGEEGLRELLKEVQTSKNEGGVSFTDLDCLLRRFPGLYSGTSSRVRQKIWIEVLYTSTRGPIKGVHDTQKYRKARWVTFKKELDFDGDISIYENKVVITSFREPPVSVLIEHADIARLIRALFTLAWEAAQERGEPESAVSLEDIDNVT